MDKKESGHRYKVGDKVEIIGNHNLHNFDIGEIVCLIGPKEKNNCCKSYWLCGDLAENQYWYVLEEDMELVEATTKPRLAEVLGVEVGEFFKIKGEPETYFVDEDGFLLMKDSLARSYSGFYTAINHPESIIRAPRLTEAEMAICKAVGAKWVSRDNGLSVAVLWMDKPRLTDSGYEGGTVAAEIYGKHFLCVRPGDCICVEEVGGDA